MNINKIYIIKELKENEYDYSVKAINIFDDSDIFEYDVMNNVVLNNIIIEYDNDSLEETNIDSFLNKNVDNSNVSTEILNRLNELNQ